jgi:FMN phosphatase YigB (HAD superfamily)
MPKRDRILFVDFDGTLCTDRFWRSAEPGLNRRIQEALFIGNPEMVRAWMRGAHSSEEIHEFLEQETGATYDELWETFVADCKSMRVERSLLDLIDTLRTTYYTVLITGNMDCFNRFTRPSLGLDTHFDAIENSYDRKLLKDEEGGRPFRIHAEQYDVPLKNTYLLDDSEKVCVVFEQLGGTAYRVRGLEDTRVRLAQLAAELGR